MSVTISQENLAKLQTYLDTIPYKYARPIVDFIDDMVAEEEKRQSEKDRLKLEKDEGLIGNTTNQQNY